MAPELQFAKDAAEIIGNGGVPLFCVFLLYLLREQRKEQKVRDAAYTAEFAAERAELKALLRSTIEVSERSNAGLDKSAEAADEVSRDLKAAVGILQLFPPHSEVVRTGLDRNFDRLVTIGEKLATMSGAK